jgi:pimeloyl-ACP methyl ester carboxylesterase
VTGDLRALAQVMGLERPVLVGQSWGGNVVFHAAALHPGAWRAIAAVDGGTISLAEDFDDPQEAWEALRPPPLSGMPVEELRRMIAGMVEGWPEGALEAVMGNFRVAEDGTVAPRLALADHRQIVEEMLANDPAEVYEGIEVPVLLLPVRGGEAAWTRRKQGSVEQALSLLPDGRVHWFDGAHDVHLQQPAEVAVQLLSLARA